MEAQDSTRQFGSTKPTNAHSKKEFADLLSSMVILDTKYPEGFDEDTESQVLGRLFEYDTGLQQEMEGILRAKSKAVHDLEWVKQHMERMEGTLLMFQKRQEQIDGKNLLKERKSLETRMAEKTGELELRLKDASVSVTGLKDKISSFESTLKNRKLELIIDRGTKEEKAYISEAISSSYITQIGDEIVNYLKKHLGVAERQLKNEFELIARLFTTICKLNVQVFKGDADARPFDIFLEKNREKSLSSYPKSSSKEMHFNEANAIPSKNLQKITVQNTDALSKEDDDGNAKVIEIGEGDGQDDDSPSVAASLPAADIEESENASNLVQNLPRIDEEASSSDESQNLPGIDEEASSSDESIIREGAERSSNMASNSQHKEQDIKNQFNGDIHRHVSEVLVEQLDEVGKLSGTESSSNLDESIAREGERPTSNSQHKEQDIKNQINHDIHRHVSEFLVEQLDEVGKLFGTAPQHNPRGHLRDTEDPHNLHGGKAEKTLGLSDIISSVPDFMRDHPMGHLKHIDDAQKLHRHSVRAEQAVGLNDIIGSVADFGRDEHINVKLDQDGNDRSGSGTNVSDVKSAKRVSFLETQGAQAPVDGDEGNQPAVERPEMIETSIMMNNTMEEDESTQDIHSSDDDETDTTAEELGQNMPKDGDSQIVQAQEKCKQLHLEIIDLQKKKESVSHLIKELEMGIIEKEQILKKTEKRVKLEFNLEDDEEEALSMDSTEYDSDETVSDYAFENIDEDAGYEVFVNEEHEACENQS